jgi:integrase
MPLTAVAINARKPEAKPVKLTDGSGLYLLVQPNGSRWWRFDYRFGGKRKTLGMGVYPEVGLADARARRDDTRRLLAQGVDPGVQRKAAKKAGVTRSENTFEAVAREWLAVKSFGWTDKNAEKMTSRLANHAFPSIGSLPIAEIGVAEVRPILTRLVERGHIEQAHRVCSTISCVFRYAMTLEKADRDPADALSDTLPPKPKRNFAHITDPDEIGGLLRAIHGYRGSLPVECALKLAPMLFVRPGELRAAQWPEFDLEHPDGPRWTIPPARRKLKKADKENPSALPHIVPLPMQAVTVLKELQPVTGRGQYLFPGERSDSRPISDNTLNAALRRLGFDKETLTTHGFRHMASTLLNEKGYNPDHIERQLSHVVPGVRGHYNKAQHMTERRQMMQDWANYLDSLKDGASKRSPVPVTA